MTTMAGREQLGKAWVAVVKRLSEDRDLVEVLETMLQISVLGLKQSRGSAALSRELQLLAASLSRDDEFAFRLLLDRTAGEPNARVRVEASHPSYAAA